MKNILTPICCLILISCASSLPQETFRQPSQASLSSSLSASDTDFTNEATPKTTDSLEVRSGMQKVIDVRATESQSIILGDAGSGTVQRTHAPTLTIYMDYACEFCREEALTMRPSIMTTYIATSRMNLEIVLMPKSPQGLLLARAALCSARNGKFSTMDTMLLHNPTIDSATLSKSAQKIGIKASTWKYCMETTTFDTEHTAPNGTSIERLPAFTLGKSHWIGVETAAVVHERIEKYLQDNVQ